MLEPMVQDYVTAAMELDRPAFADRIKAAVLIRAMSGMDEAFQNASTRALDGREQNPIGMRSASLEHRAKVVELSSMRQQRIEQISIGRSEDNDVVLLDETVSSVHAMFLRHPKTGEFLIQDQESTNGSSLNGSPLVPYRSTRLHDGDVVSFGDMAFLFFSPEGFYDAIQQMIEER